jgi:hypothetical protein
VTPPHTHTHTHTHTTNTPLTLRTNRHTYCESSCTWPTAPPSRSNSHRHSLVWCRPARNSGNGVSSNTNSDDATETSKDGNDDGNDVPLNKRLNNLLVSHTHATPRRAR